jgi:hypothetical protein
MLHENTAVAVQPAMDIHARPGIMHLTHLAVGARLKLNSVVGDVIRDSPGSKLCPAPKLHLVGPAARLLSLPV